MLSVHHRQCCIQTILEGEGEVEVSCNRGREQNVFNDLGRNIDLRLDTKCVCVCVCVCVLPFKEKGEMYIEAVHAVGACATIKFA